MLATAIGKSRSSVCRYLSDPEGLIDAEHQLSLIKAARDRGFELDASDFIPDATIEGLKDEKGVRAYRKRHTQAQGKGVDLP